MVFSLYFIYFFHLLLQDVVNAISCSFLGKVLIYMERCCHVMNHDRRKILKGNVIICFVYKIRSRIFCTGTTTGMYPFFCFTFVFVFVFAFFQLWKFNSGCLPQYKYTL